MINHCRHLGKRNLKSISREETVDKEIGESETAHNKTCYSKCYLRSTFGFVEQDAASKSHHCANTNVGGNAFMTTEEVNFIRQTGRRPFRFMEIVDSYFFILFPLVIFLIGSTLLLNTFGHADKEAFSSIIIFIVGLVSLYWTTKRLWDNQRFKRIRTSKNTEDNIQKIKEAINKLDWELYLDNKERVIAFTKTTWFSWGEQVTIIADGKDILINSRPTKQPITIYEDERNLKRFLHEFNLS